MPHLIQFNDNNHYVVKFQNNGCGIKVLINELVVTKFSQLVDLPNKEGLVVEVSQEFIDNSSNLKGLQAGKQFATPFIDNASNFDVNMIDRMINKDQLPQVIITDTLFCNSDRHQGNLLIQAKTTSGTPSFTVYAIDHTHIYAGNTNWDEKTLKNLMSDDKLYDTLNLLQCDKTPKDKALFDHCLSKIENVSSQDIALILNQVPQEWGLTNNMCNQLNEFIELRKKSVRKIIEKTTSVFKA